MSSFRNEERLAEHLAQTAGQLLLQLQASSLLRDKALGGLGDAVANTFLVESLRSLMPEDAILSEEEAASASRLSSSRVWIIDPLDGTREYSEGRTDWAVHVALAIDHVPVVAAVALPGRGETFVSAEPPPLKLCANRKILVSRTR